MGQKIYEIDLLQRIKPDERGHSILLSKISAIIVVVLLFGALFFTVGMASAKTDVGGIDVTLSTSPTDRGDDKLNLDVGDDFYTHIKLKDPEENKTNLDIHIEIIIDGVKVYDDDEKDIDLVEGEPYYIVISSGKFENVWDENLMNYRCGRENIEVRISGDVNRESDDNAELDIDGMDGRLRVDINPDNPSADSRITVTVTDEDRDKVRGATVKFTHLGDNEKWDDSDDYWDDDTDSDGEIKVRLSDERVFRSDPYGRYQIDVWENRGDYCKRTRTMDIKHSLHIKEILPSKPVVGERIRVKVVDENDVGVLGAMITLSSAGFHETYTTDSGGYASFTLNNDGSYVLIASKSKYIDSQSETLVVFARKSIGVNINPEEQELNKAIDITLMDEEGKALANARVIITKPDGTNEPVMTVPSSGRVSYIPRLVGTYTVTSEAEGYKTTTDNFRVQRAFSIIVPDVLEVNKNITIIISDSFGNPLEDTMVSIESTNISGKTDSLGRFTFMLSEPKEYTLTISKEGYATLNRKISTLGKLKIILEPEEIELGDSVSIRVVDGQGNSIPASIEITKPDGTNELITGDSYTPKVSGNYGITAIRKDYKSDTENLVVRPAPLTLESRIRDNTLIIGVSSRGEGISNINVQVETPSWKKDIVTDDTGRATLSLTNLELSSDITISVDKEGYEKKEIIQEIPRFNLANYSIPLIFGTIIVIAIAIILIASSGLGKGKKKKGKNSLTKGKKTTSLNKV